MFPISIQRLNAEPSSKKDVKFTNEVVLSGTPDKNCAYQRTYWVALLRVSSWKDLLEFNLIVQASQWILRFFKAGRKCVGLLINLSDLSASCPLERLIWSKVKKKTVPEWTGEPDEGSPRSPHHQLRPYHFPFAVSKKKLKRPIVFLTPLGWKHLLCRGTVRGLPAD